MSEGVPDGPDLRCISWNIHRCKGNDGLFDPERTQRILINEVCRPDTDALILQEADGDFPPHEGLLNITEIERSTGLRYAHPDIQHRWSERSHGFLGVIFFLHPDIRVESIELVDLPGRCHRGAVVAELCREGKKFRLIGTHLSLSQALRLAQMRTISQHIFRKESKPTILVGDLNEWRPWGGLALSPKLLGQTFIGPAKATFPINRPFLPLDRALAIAPARVVETEVLDGAGIRVASDHRPLSAHIRLGG
ncbi:MAG: endonuclease/exonuclease/phosphatase family protein [Pseudomonadota bacterium]